MKRTTIIVFSMFLLAFSRAYTLESPSQETQEEFPRTHLNQTDLSQTDGISEEARNLQLFSKMKSKRASEEAAEPCSKSNWYYNFRASECEPCPRGCDECWQEMDDYVITCTACSFGYTTTTTFDQCYQVCMNGTFFDDTHDACYSCTEGCKSCEWDWTDEKFKCRECLPGYTLSSDETKCLDKTCEPGLIFDDDLEKCVRCQDKHCETCIWDYLAKDSRCVDCALNFTLSRGACNYNERSNVCSGSKYYDEYERSCLTCPPYCSSCSQAVDSNQMTCYGCEEGTTLNEKFGRCEPECAATEFYDFEVDYCLACPNGCSRCASTITGGIECSACVLGFKLINGRCYKNCGRTEYFHVNAFNCLDCPSDCQQCFYNEHSKEQQCFTCQDDGAFNLNFHSCEPDCKSSQFYNYLETLTCEDCPDNCNGCSQDLEKGLECASCSNKYWKNSYDQCLPEDCPKGSVWDRNYQCLACNLEKYYYDPKFRECIPLTSCPNGYYQNQTSLQCYRCMDGCDFCSERDICLGCNQAYILQSNGECESRCTEEFYIFDQRSDSCKLTCPEGYYKSPDKTTCLTCPDGCVSCKNDTYCSECWIDYNLTETNQCEQLCAHPNVFFNTFTLECDMICEKDSQWKNFEKFQCEDCPVGCSFCANASYCSACDNQHLLNATDNLCHAICKQESAFWNYTAAECMYYQNCSAEEEFLNKTVNECQRCIEGCQYCEEASACSFCYSNYYQVESDNTCEMRCPDTFYIWSESKQDCIPWVVCPTGSYLDLNARQCKQCGDDCMECNNTRECNTCFSESMEPSKGRCVNKCKDKKTYWDRDSQSCQPKCSGNNFWNPITEVCFFCEDGLFFNNVTIQCDRCPKGCKYCQEEDACLTCYDEYYRDEDFMSPTLGECVLRCEDESNFWNVTTQACEPKCVGTVYYSYQLKRCRTCSKGCLNCTNRTCLYCDEPQYVKAGNLNFCYDVCHDNFTEYDEYTKTCTDPKCSGGYYFDETASSCRYCPSNCNTCNKTGKCNDCRYPQYKQYLTDSQEWIPEPADQLLDGTEFQCLDYCLEDGKVFVENTQTCEERTECEDTGEYYDDFTNLCLSCSDNCLKCSSSITCTKCDTPHYQIEYALGELYCEDACVDVGKVWVDSIEDCEYEEECETNQYLDATDNNCYDCGVTCATCSDADTCDTLLIHLPGTIDFDREAPKEERSGAPTFKILAAIIGIAILGILLWLYLAVRRRGKKQKEEQMPVPQTDREHPNNVTSDHDQKEISERSMEKNQLSFASEHVPRESLPEKQEGQRQKSISTFADLAHT